MIPNNIDKRLQVNATTGVGEAVELGGVRVITAYITGSAGVSAGAVQLEHAPSKDYTGTWAALGGAAVTVVANTTAAVVVAGTAKAVRARISTPIVGGTVTVLLVAN
jgi:hypothetical protein